MLSDLQKEMLLHLKKSGPCYLTYVFAGRQGLSDEYARLHADSYIFTDVENSARDTITEKGENAI